MARDVNALINKCENAITQEEKTIYVTANSFS